jgi:hypothetical protein
MMGAAFRNGAIATWERGGARGGGGLQQRLHTLHAVHKVLGQFGDLVARKVQ